jgi:hypothetical protein
MLDPILESYRDSVLKRGFSGVSPDGLACDICSPSCHSYEVTTEYEEHGMNGVIKRQKNIQQLEDPTGPKLDVRRDERT